VPADHSYQEFAGPAAVGEIIKPVGPSTYRLSYFLPTIAQRSASSLFYNPIRVIPHLRLIRDKQCPPNRWYKFTSLCDCAPPYTTLFLWRH